MTTKTKKAAAAAALDKIATMPAAQADDIIRRLLEDAQSAQMALEMALAARGKAAV
jgi:hypothetical protein